jgi:hypothetical protein
MGSMVSSAHGRFPGGHTNLYVTRRPDANTSHKFVASPIHTQNGVCIPMVNGLGTLHCFYYSHLFLIVPL